MPVRHKIIFCIAPLLLSLLLVSGCMQKAATVCYSPDRGKPGQVKRSSASLGYTAVVKNDSSCREEFFTEEIDSLHDYFSRWRGVRYRYGGLTKKGIDCSGLTLRAYKELYDVKLPRTVVGQAKKGVKVKKSSLRPGDLVFFKTGRLARHVGIYLGENTFIHASPSKGVMLSDLDNVYWSKRYWQAKRLEPLKS